MSVTRRTVLALTAGMPFALADAAQADGKADFEIVIKGSKFSPDTLDVPAGSLVRFTNRDSAPHTGTAADGSFDTGDLKSGRSKDVTVPAGEHAFRCRYHASMKGIIRAS